ncbi:hypothetical protein MNB_SV-13-1509 [hydrothermal vent metagenome]|uniref:Uncharacterized protein n=1 Tax=hydrothermal vent metagenome TaxID=652676 RepID=A0A1W1CYQ9_9ZZZZ
MTNKAESVQADKNSVEANKNNFFILTLSFDIYDTLPKFYKD